MAKFTPYKYQLILDKLLDRHRVVEVIKSRQLGFSQFCISRFAHKSLLNPAYCAISFLRNGEDANAFSRRTKYLLCNYHSRLEIENVSLLKAPGCGELYFKNSSKEGSRSYDSVSDFLFDEAGFSSNIAAIYAASAPSSGLVEGSSKIICSTPSSKTTWFWERVSDCDGEVDIEDICNAVAEGKLYSENLPGFYYFVSKSQVLKIILHWRCHPVYGAMPNYLKWRKEQDGLDEETLAREYDLKFIDSSVSVFSATVVSANIGGHKTCEAQENRDYYIGIDTSYQGTDYTVACVLEEYKGKFYLIDWYRDRGKTSQYYLFHLSKLIEKYRPKKIGIETNAGGQIYLEQLSEKHPGIDFKAIRTSQDTKAVMVAQLTLALERELLRIPEKCPLIQELLLFQRQGSKLEAPSGKNDDFVLSMAFAIEATKDDTKGLKFSQSDLINLFGK